MELVEENGERVGARTRRGEHPSVGGVTVRVAVGMDSSVGRGFELSVGLTVVLGT